MQRKDGREPMTDKIPLSEQLDDIERVIKEQEDMANHIGNLEGDD